MAQLLAGLFAGAGGGGVRQGDPARLGPTDVNGDLSVLDNIYLSGGGLSISNAQDLRSVIQMYAGTLGLPGPLVTPYLSIYFGTQAGRPVPSFQIIRNDVVNAFAPDSNLFRITPTQEEGAENNVVLNGNVKIEGVVAGGNGLYYDGPYSLAAQNLDRSFNFIGACLYLVGSPDVGGIGYCNILLDIAITPSIKGLPLLKLISNNATQQQVVEIYDVNNVHIGTISILGLQVVDVIINPESPTGLFAVYSPYIETGNCNPNPDPPPAGVRPALSKLRPWISPSPVSLN